MKYLLIAILLLTLNTACFGYSKEIDPKIVIKENEDIKWELSQTPMKQYLILRSMIKVLEQKINHIERRLDNEPKIIIPDDDGFYVMPPMWRDFDEQLRRRNR